MSIQQQQLTLPSYTRGIHLITKKIEHELKMFEVKNGLLNLFLQHTSAALTINENADPTVRCDMEEWLNQIAPENEPYYRHTYEGPDDLPAHLKSSAIGVSLNIPVVRGQLALGTWQGIYLLEFRTHAPGRSLLLTFVN